MVQSASRITELIELFGSDGLPMQARILGESRTQILYDLTPNGVELFELESSGSVQVGYTKVTPDKEMPVPSGSAIFQTRSLSSGAIITEAGVGAIHPTRKARIFVDQVRTQTGVALASPGNNRINVAFRLLDRYGEEIETTHRVIPANGKSPVYRELNWRGSEPSVVSWCRLDFRSSIQTAGRTDPSSLRVADHHFSNRTYSQRFEVKEVVLISVLRENDIFIFAEAN